MIDRPYIIRWLIGSSLFGLVFSGVGCGTTSVSSDATEAPSQTSEAGAPSTPTPTEELGLQFFARDTRGEATREVDKVVYGDQVVVRARGLQPGATVTLRSAASSFWQKNRATVAVATFVADASGVVDTGRQAPTSGTYDDVDPDGLFWSMEDAAIPKWMSAEPYSATIALEIDGEMKVHRTLQRLAFAEDVKCEPVSEDGIIGTYCAKQGAPKRTPVLAFGGSEGGTFSSSWMAMIFASWGIPTLGVGYFGVTPLPKELKRIPLEYFEGAMKWLDARPEARAGETIVSGGSRGGELALLLGATYPRVVGVIADVPSNFTWASLDSTAAAWTLGGVDVPYVPSSAAATPRTIAGPNGGVAYQTTPMFQRDVADASPTALEKATIAVEKTNGPVLLLAGERDDLWPSCDFSKRAFARLSSSGHTTKYADEMECFADAGHSISLDGGPTTRSMWSEMGGMTISLGGTAKGIAKAQRASDDKRHAFLERVSRH